LHNTGAARGQTPGADVKAAAAWDLTRGSREVVVCLIDDGFDLDHPDLTGPGKLIAPWNFVDDTPRPRPAGPGDNHGTACAGLAIAEENGQGVVGLAPGCAWMPLRIGDWLSDALVVDLFQYAAYHGADVISCGWSAAAWNFPLSTKIHAALHQAATRGRSNQKGCVILFAAGDENRPLDGHKDGHRSYQGFALHPDVLAVAASNSQDRRAGYSNYGFGLAVCAPSSGMQRLVTTDRMGGAGFSGGDYTFDFGGTSAAVSLAAGLAGLVLSANPRLSAAAVRQIIRDTAEKIDPANGAYSAGVSPWYGCGRIHAGRAVTRAGGGEIDVLPHQVLLENRPNRTIPDRGALEDLLPCGLDHKLRAVEVGLEIRNVYHGLLRLALLPPTGQPIILFDPASAPIPNHDLVRSYDSARDPGLFDALIGASTRGDWRLSVENRADFATGVLARWSLTFTY
jgi:subtilisin family serine protease